MSHESFIRAGYDAWRERDLEGWLEKLDPQIELQTTGAFPDLEPVYRGHDGLRTFWDAMLAPWESFHLNVESIVEDEDRAAVAVSFHARGRGSGVTTELRQGHAIRFSNGRIAKVSTHRSFEQALRAVGLSDQGAHAGS